MLKHRNHIALTTALALTAGLVVAGGAEAAPAKLPKPKQVNVKLDGKRHGAFPKAPGVKLRGRTERAPVVQRVGKRRKPVAGAKRLRPRKPGQANSSIGGWHGPYANKLAWIHYYVDNYNRRILGNRYRQPALYPGVERYSTIDCGTQKVNPRNNAIYCPAWNYIAWDTSWFQGFFNYAYGGDTSVATIHAHEFGHGSQHMLGLRGRKLGYSLYRELYADCMAGAWAGWMYANRLLDNIGVGDYREALNVLAWIASPNTPDRTHGTVSERQDFFRYGWSNGAQACVNWAVS